MYALTIIGIVAAAWLASKGLNAPEDISKY